MPLAQRVRDLMQRKDISQAELARKSMVSAATISRFFNGGTASVENLESMEAVLEAAPDKPGEQQQAAMQLPDHCVKCRAEQNAHNAALRDDFNRRHEETRADYEERIKELKEFYAQRHAMHEAEKERMSKEHDSTKNRAKIFTAYSIILTVFICALLAVDVLHGGIGWFRYSIFGGNHEVWEEVIRYIVSWMA